MTSHTIVHDFTRPMPPAHPSDLQGRLREIASGIPGHLAMTILSGEGWDGGAYVTHWPEAHGAPRFVGQGDTVDAALDAARKYVEGWR